MHSCYTLAVLLGTIFNMNNVVPNLEQSNTLRLMGPFMLTGQVAALEEEGSVLSGHVTGEDSESEVEVVGGLNVCLAQAMSCYQWEEQQCFMCGSPGHFIQGCPHHEAFR